MDLKHKLINFLTFIYILIFKIRYDLIIFSHVPQCGGNSILHIFKFFLGYRFLNIHRNEIDYLMKRPKVLKKRLDGKILILGHFGIDFVHYIEKLYLKKRIYYLFNIRDPKHRYLSNYFRNKKLNGLNLDLRKFLIKRKKDHLDNIFIRYLSGKNIYRTGVTKIDKKLLKIGYQNIKKFDSVVFLESLNADMYKVLKKLFYFPILINFMKTHKNKVSNSKFKKISQSEKNILFDLTKYDLNLYKNLKKKYEKISRRI